MFAIVALLIFGVISMVFVSPLPEDAYKLKNWWRTILVFTAILILILVQVSSLK